LAVQDIPCLDIVVWHVYNMGLFTEINEGGLVANTDVKSDARKIYSDILCFKLYKFITVDVIVNPSFSSILVQFVAFFLHYWPIDYFYHSQYFYVWFYAKLSNAFGLFLSDVIWHSVLHFGICFSKCINERYHSIFIVFAMICITVKLIKCRKILYYFF